MKRIRTKGLVLIALLMLGCVLTWPFWPRPSVSVIFDGVYTNAFGATRPWLVITNPFAFPIKYQMLPPEVRSETGWSESQSPRIIPASGRPYETGLIFGGETLEPRTGFRFIVGEPTDHRPYRYPVYWSLPPEVAAARPKWKKRFDELAMRWRGRPTFVTFGIARSPAIIPRNDGGAANGSQPVSAETNQPSAAPGPGR